METYSEIWKALLVENNHGCWSFPGGKINKNESYIDCAIREVSFDFCTIFLKIKIKQLNIRFTRRLVVMCQITCRKMITLKQQIGVLLGILLFHIFQKVIRFQPIHAMRLKFIQNIFQKISIETYQFISEYKMV